LSSADGRPRLAAADRAEVRSKRLPDENGPPRATLVTAVASATWAAGAVSEPNAGIQPLPTRLAAFRGPDRGSPRAAEGTAAAALRSATPVQGNALSE
jgi:hypothetical protein